MKKLFAATILYLISASVFADMPEYMVIEKAGLNCSIFSDDDSYLCQTNTIAAPDAASDTLVLSYQDIVDMGGHSFVPVVSYKVASK